MSTTHTNELTEQSAKRVAIQLGGEVLLRDYFAAKVMQAEMMNGVHESDFPEYAGRAYKMADSMLKEREV